MHSDLMRSVREQTALSSEAAMCWDTPACPLHKCKPRPAHKTVPGSREPVLVPLARPLGVCDNISPLRPCPP